MVGHFFKSAPMFKCVQTTSGPACCTENFERMGVDFDFELCPPPPGFAQIIKFTGPACVCEDCRCSPCLGQCHAFAVAANPCAAAACTAATCNAVACGEATGGCENCPAQHAVRHVDHFIKKMHPACEMLKLFETIAELSAEKAAAEAALEAREEAHEEFAELLESMIELVAQNASLEAQLAAHAENAKLSEKMIELASENARLKAQVELADARHEILRGSLEVAIENERLKLRVAELEKHQATATAARTRGERKAR
jgi:hypothetical protein